MIFNLSKVSQLLQCLEGNLTSSHVTFSVPVSTLQQYLIYTYPYQIWLNAIQVNQNKYLPNFEYVEGEISFDELNISLKY